MSDLSWMQPRKKDEVALPLQVPEIRDQASYHYSVAPESYS